jgi:hypothetical protein
MSLNSGLLMVLKPNIIIHHIYAHKNPQITLSNLFSRQI